jgi:DNA-binding NarL/FixJ family response regulator
MPEMEGLQATHLVKARWPQVRVLVLTLCGEYEAEALVVEAMALLEQSSVGVRNRS